jgi:phosphatidylserine/phosphatidylglycerophosphate/cardiolipin synthase-like enzyme
MSDKFESQHSLSPTTIWSDIVVGRENGYLKIFFYISRGEHVKHFVIDAYL